MISSEVQRTLVKSPPELWAELSDPDALARHLGELGEIRITRVEPERKVEWEAEGTNGTVQIKASGWGTKVTLSVTRELPPAVEGPPAEEAATVEDVLPPAEPPTTEDAPAAEETPTTEDAPIAEETPTTEDAPAVEEAPARREAPEPEAPPARKRGFFARLFGRREPAPAPDEASTQPSPQEAPAPAEIDLPKTPEPVAMGSPAAAPEPLPLQPQAADAPEPVAEAAEEVTAVLVAVLDRLGAAHHRPFSRS